MNVPVIEIVYGASVVSAVPVVINARKRARRSPAFDGLIAASIPVLGVVMYVSSVRMGLTPAPVEKEVVVAEPAPESPTLVSELTAEIRRLRAHVAELEARLGNHPPAE